MLKWVLFGERFLQQMWTVPDKKKKQMWTVDIPIGVKLITNFTQTYFPKIKHMDRSDHFCESGMSPQQPKTGSYWRIQNLVHLLLSPIRIRQRCWSSFLDMFLFFVFFFTWGYIYGFNGRVLWIRQTVEWSAGLLEGYGKLVTLLPTPLSHPFRASTVHVSPLQRISELFIIWCNPSY